MWSEGGICKQSKGPRWGRHEENPAGLTDLRLSTRWERLCSRWSVRPWSGQPAGCPRRTSAGKPCRRTWTPQACEGGEPRREAVSTENRTPVNTAEAAGRSPVGAWSDLTLSEVTAGAPRPHFDLSTHCSRSGKPLRHQPEVRIPAGKAADRPGEAMGQHPWGLCKLCPGARWLGLATLPRDQGCNVTADLKEACSEAPEVTLLPKEIIYQGVDI